MLANYPTLTVILNTHNTPSTVKFTSRALDSILAQEFSEPWEVIVVNDGKPLDELVEALVPYADKFADKGVALTFFGIAEESGYQCAPKNAAIYHTRGEYICFLDMDNEYLPGHLQKLYDAMVEGSVWPDFVYARRRFVIDEECPSKVTLPGGTEVELQERDSPFVEWNAPNFYMMTQSPLMGFIDTSDFITSRGAFWRLEMATEKMWDEACRRFGDWNLLVRGVSMAGWRGKAIDEVLTTYHFHGGNLQLTRAATETPKAVPIS